MMIELKDINKTYFGAQPLHVLKGINLNVQEGEMVSIMGASGSGKSTMLNIMGILDDYDEGEYLLEGKLVKNLDDRTEAIYRNKLIGFIFQSFNLIYYKNAMENVALPLYYRGVKRKERNDLAMEYLDKVGLAEHWHHLPMQLSGGQRQRVGIAMGMTYRPKLLLADEPTSALDVTTQAQIVRQMMELRDEYGTSIIIVTHNLGVAAYMGDKIVVMKRGEVVDQGKREYILHRSDNPYTKLLLDAVPTLGGKRYV